MHKRNSGFHIFTLIVSEAIFASFAITAIANYKSLVKWAITVLLCTSAVACLALLHIAIKHISTLLGYGDVVAHTIKTNSKAARSVATRGVKSIKNTSKSPALLYGYLSETLVMTWS